ncbi:hypothetical protein [Actinopolyspora halophila]|uniref:hypothetical protein n=1 Tax=Actinopolyspora halophila TaxID=1850 RepID=UPI0003783CD9|nr:hypothetical protein [Actinopolyspora halophila]
MTSMDVETHARAEHALVAQLRRILAYWIAVTVALTQRAHRAEQQLAEVRASRDEAHRQAAAYIARALDAEAESAVLRQRNAELLRDRDQCHSAAAEATQRCHRLERRAELAEQSLRLGIARPDPLTPERPGLLRRCADRVLAPFRGTGAW